MNVGVARQEIEAVHGAMDVGINVGNLDGGSVDRTERDSQSYGNVGYNYPFILLLYFVFNVACTPNLDMRTDVMKLILQSMV